MHCPQCKIELTGRPSQCPRCRTDLSLLADLMSEVEILRTKAHDAKSSGKIGPAIEAYLQMLEIDPTDAEAREAVGESVRAIRTVLKLETKSRSRAVWWWVAIGIAATLGIFIGRYG